ncbi:MAG: YbaB/EbfC family nucleoid-associated protein [Rhodospirillaceae bacterium TMED8]|nr:YbaB/EbfC family nucleoid-associated protein [Magnetovibrio sp.]OUT53256.1 MAG: YbaB/EbfC family nucleoid-associated protein [Rhodospirillaceae bacterium TMED8]|tara:strand:- start:1570 stop:1893 length:324 start_codon:yes stop_codon:yes gene_type:complete
MKNLSQMLKQAQELQGKMQEIQEQLTELEVTGTSGGGMCKVILNGKGMAKSIHIDPAIVTPDDASLLEDLILAAMNDARVKADERMRDEMQKLTGGLPLPPGTPLPF